MECRVRRALRADDAPPADDGTLTVEAAEALNLLSKITGELLAHYSPRETKAFFFKLITWRERWKREAFVMVQREPQGQA
jgi:hypothetical protein